MDSKILKEADNGLYKYSKIEIKDNRGLIHHVVRVTIHNTKGLAKFLYDVKRKIPKGFDVVVDTQLENDKQAQEVLNRIHYISVEGSIRLVLNKDTKLHLDSIYIQKGGLFYIYGGNVSTHMLSVNGNVGIFSSFINDIDESKDSAVYCAGGSHLVIKNSAFNKGITVKDSEIVTIDKNTLPFISAERSNFIGEVYPVYISDISLSNKSTAIISTLDESYTIQRVQSILNVIGQHFKHNTVLHISPDSDVYFIDRPIGIRADRQANNLHIGKEDKKTLFNIVMSKYFVADEKLISAENNKIEYEEEER